MGERVVESDFVFDRLQAAQLPPAQRILVLERPSGGVRAGREKRFVDEQHSDLRSAGVLGPAERP